MEFATLGAHCTVATCKIRGESEPFSNFPVAIELLCGLRPLSGYAWRPLADAFFPLLMHAQTSCRSSVTAVVEFSVWSIGECPKRVLSLSV